jgi:outer membrane protein, heavy metal efflux system
MKHSVNFYLIVLCAVVTSAQNNIENILGSVLKNNKSLVANSQLVSARKLEYKTGITPDDPRVDYDYLIGSPAGAGNQTDFSITQAIDFPTTYPAKKHMSDRMIERSELEYVALRQSILFDAKMSCFSIIYLNKRQAELSRRVTQVNQLFMGYQTKMKNGEATILEVNKAQLMLLNLRTESALNESEIKRTRAKLTELNGGIATNLTDTLYPAVPNVPEFDKIDSLIEANDVRVKVYSKEKDISTARLKVMKGLALPKLEAGYHSQSILGQKYQGAHIGFSIPLWQNKNTVKTEKANLVFSDFRIAEHRTEHYYENQQIYERYLVLKATLAEYAAIFNSTNNSELLGKSLKAGNISSIEYFMELSYFYTAYDNYLRAENEYHVSISTLYKYQL